MIRDDRWPVARLIPISSASGIEAQERRAASALLAVLGAVQEFGRTLLRPIGAPAGQVETFIEVPFTLNGQKLRPDGVILVTRGQTAWSAMVEVKTAANPIEGPQVEQYLDLARENDCDALITISNQYVTSSSQYPVVIDKRKIGRLTLAHWSWIDVLTEAIVQKEYRGVKDPDQAYILQELIRYLSDPRSGAVAFAGMGAVWATVRDGARERTLRRNDPQVEEIARRWDELVRYLCLELTKDLGRDVQPVVSARERSPQQRTEALRDSLVSEGMLNAELKVPDAAGSLVLEANLGTRQVIIATRLRAPEEGRNKSRVSWLLRQLAEAPGILKIEARMARSSNSLPATLKDAQDDPSVLYPEQGKEIREFSLSLSKDMGLKGDVGRGSFVTSVIDTAEEFYAKVLQHLSSWKPRPPKLILRTEEHPADELPVGVPQAVAEAIEKAEHEASDLQNEGAGVENTQAVDPE